MRLTAISLSAVAIFAEVALSQENPATPGPPQPSSTAWRAPVGHRQPRMSDLPPDVAQRETQPGGTASGQKSQPDSRLTICHGC
jgi:hypothetical protein